MRPLLKTQEKDFHKTYQKLKTFKCYFSFPNEITLVNHLFYRKNLINIKEIITSIARDHNPALVVWG